MKMHAMSKSQGKWAFFCPACQCAHYIVVNGGGWGWNGDVEKPTITPSILAWADHFRCHSFVTDGKIRFLDDCSHNMKGQTVDLPDFPSSEPT